MKNRIIKFRIWHNVLKRFLPQQADYHEVIAPLMDINGNFYSWSSQHWGMDNEIWEGNDLVIQQFTGLLDKNNKEIYEGDIIKYQYDSAYSDKFDKSVVEYEEFEPDKWGYQLGQGYGNVEIIGNIFENPDLT